MLVCNVRTATFSIHIQGDQKVSVHLMIFCNCQVHRDFLITLYKNILVIELVTTLDIALIRSLILEAVHIAGY